MTEALLNVSARLVVLAGEAKNKACFLDSRRFAHLKEKQQIELDFGKKKTQAIRLFGLAGDIAVSLSKLKALRVGNKKQQQQQIENSLWLQRPPEWTMCHVP
ncbi:UNVERIFIED_CONTAM: hypothetical protein K2H54_013372 [Gekko kuhli]